MEVSYFGVYGCTLGQLGNRAVLIAPPPERTGMPVQTLLQHNFLKLEDGSWCHYLTNEELHYIQSMPPNTPVIFSAGAGSGFVQPAADSPEDNRLANILCTLSLSLWALNTAIIQLSDSSRFVPYFSLASLVLLIIARIKAPHNKFAKVVQWIYIILFAVGVVLAIIGMLFLAYFCSSCANECGG